MEVTPLSVRGYAPSMKGGKEKRDPRHAHTEERRLPFFVSDFSCVTPPAPPKMMILAFCVAVIYCSSAGALATSTCEEWISASEGTGCRVMECNRYDNGNLVIECEFYVDEAHYHVSGPISSCNPREVAVEGANSHGFVMTGKSTFIHTSRVNKRIKMFESDIDNAIDIIKREQEAIFETEDEIQVSLDVMGDMETMIDHLTQEIFSAEWSMEHGMREDRCGVIVGWYSCYNADPKFFANLSELVVTTCKGKLSGFP